MSDRGLHCVGQRVYTVSDRGFTPWLTEGSHLDGQRVHTLTVRGFTPCRTEGLHLVGQRGNPLVYREVTRWCTERYPAGEQRCRQWSRAERQRRHRRGIHGRREGVGPVYSTPAHPTTVRSRYPHTHPTRPPCPATWVHRAVLQSRRCSPGFFRKVGKDHTRVLHIPGINGDWSFPSRGC